MVMMVPPPAVAKTRLPAGFLTTLALLYNKCLPSLAPGRYTETTHKHTHACTPRYKQKCINSCKNSDSHACTLSPALSNTNNHTHTSLYKRTTQAQPEPTHASSYKQSPLIRPLLHVHTLTACVWAIVSDSE